MPRYSSAETHREGQSLDGRASISPSPPLPPLPLPQHQLHQPRTGRDSNHSRRRSGPCESLGVPAHQERTVIYQGKRQNPAKCPPQKNLSDGDAIPGTRRPDRPSPRLKPVIKYPATLPGIIISNAQTHTKRVTQEYHTTIDVPPRRQQCAIRKSLPMTDAQSSDLIEEGLPIKRPGE